MDNLRDEFLNKDIDGNFLNDIYEEYLKSKTELDGALSDYEDFHNDSPAVFLAFVEARAAYDFHHNQIDIHGYPEGTFEYKAYLNKIGKLIEKVIKDSEQ